MAERVALLNGKNIEQDYDISKILQSLANPGVVSGLAVTSGQVGIGHAFIQVTRGSETFYVLYQNTANVTIDTTGTKKVWVAVNQTKVDDGSGNSIDGTGIGVITTGASYPASNYIPLASITAGVITDDRSFFSLKSNRVNGTLKLSKYPIDVIASATTGISNEEGSFIFISGTTTISSFGYGVPGDTYKIVFHNSLTLVHSSNLVLPTLANIVTQADDSMIIVNDGLRDSSGKGGTNWRVISYQRADGSALAYTPVASTRSTFVAGEDIIACNVVYIQEGSYPDAGNLVAQTTQGSAQNITNGQTFGQTFTTGSSYDTGKLNYVQFYKGNYTGSVGLNNATAYLYSAPGGTLLATSNTVQVHTSYTWYTFTFASQPVLTNNTTYYIQVNYSDTSGASQYFPLGYQNTNVYGGGNAYFNGVSQSSYDLAFYVNVVFNLGPNGTLGKAGTTTAVKKKFIGFATNTASKGGNVIVDTAGISNTQGGIIPGRTYYLSTNLGIIDTVATDTPVGTAVSSTGICIVPKTI